VDPLLLEALRFGVAILAGGIVAVIAQRIAFGHSQRLAAQDREEQLRSHLRALAAEIEENIRLTDVPQSREGKRPFAPTRRSRWDAAHAIVFSDAAFAALVVAYESGDLYNSVLERLVHGAPGGAVGWTLEAMSLAQEAHEAFEAARDAVKPLV
jgi:hypothetical protein